MREPFLFVILAVTKTFDKYCIAGMDYEGNWIRPLPVGGDKFWPSVVYRNNEFIKVGDVWEITAYKKEYDDISPGHTEDIRLTKSPTLQSRLTNQQLISFVQRFQEDETALMKTINAESRSLCLIKVDGFENFLHENNFNGRIQVRITFLYNRNQYNNTTSTPGFPLTDLKWRAYTYKQIQVSSDWDSVYICIGLARKEPKKDLSREYPMVISVITNPEVPLLPTYPKE